MPTSPGRPLPPALAAALANPQVASDGGTCGLSRAWDRIASAVAMLDEVPKPNPGQKELAFLRRAQLDLAQQILAAKPDDPLAGAALKVRAGLALLPRRTRIAIGLLRSALDTLDEAVTDAKLWPARVVPVSEPVVEPEPTPDGEWHFEGQLEPGAKAAEEAIASIIEALPEGAIDEAGACAVLEAVLFALGACTIDQPSAAFIEAMWDGLRQLSCRAASPPATS